MKGIRIRNSIVFCLSKSWITLHRFGEVSVNEMKCFETSTAGWIQKICYFEIRLPDETIKGFAPERAVSLA